ncbi:2,3-dihydro-2,3-dihydroxybenzoate dehydrogenase [Agrobacterium vitis]|uniref:2,3-dihydro-2,3-dihydroxybenzoate dehydrogenase n=1 Tax=Agrobacterium vitis TaxID=373 RepID=UPI003D2C9F7D
MSDLEFIGKTALITGAAGGIGTAIARQLAAAGVQLALLDKDGDALMAVAAELSDYNVPVETLVVDLCDPHSIASAVTAAEEALGEIDFLASVAGYLKAGVHEQITVDDWNKHFDINARGLFFVTQAVLEKMRPRRRGAIVAITSNAAFVPRQGMVAYAASKAAAEALMKCISLEVAPMGIRCNTVAPGSTNTEMLRSLWLDDNGRERTLGGDPESFRLGIPLRRIADPEDIANAVVFLLSERAKHVTLHTMTIDGGASLGA